MVFTPENVVKGYSMVWGQRTVSRCGWLIHGPYSVYNHPQSNSTPLKGMFKLPLFSDCCFDEMVLRRALIRRMDDPKKATSIYDFTAKDIDGNEVLISQNQTNENLTFSGELVKIQGTCLCHCQCSLQVRKD